MKTMMLRCAAVVFLVAAVAVRCRAGGDVKIEPDVIYGRKDGMALTLDVVRPAKANGAGVLWIQTGGWYSNWTDSKVRPTSAKHFLDRCHTVVIVRHASPPKQAGPEP